MREMLNILKNNGALWAVIAFLVSILLIVGGFLVPPLGIIDGSVLTATGELLGFATLFKVPNIIESVKEGKKITFTKGDLNIEVEGKEGDND